MGGTKGTTINAIRATTKASVFVDYEDGAEFATVTLAGLTENVDMAEALVKEKLVQTRLETASKVVEVPQEVVGLVIGPGGSHLRQIQESSGCSVKFIKANELDES